MDSEAVSERKTLKKRGRSTSSSLSDMVREVCCKRDSLEMGSGERESMFEREMSQEDKNSGTYRPSGVKGSLGRIQSDNRFFLPIVNVVV